MKQDDPRWLGEMTNRSMDRLMATAQYGGQPRRGSRQTVISVPGAVTGERVSVAIVEGDIVAILDEMDADGPCGICHANPCTFRLPKERLA